MLYRVPAEISGMYYTEINYDTKPLIIFMQIEDSLFSSWESFQLLCSKILCLSRFPVLELRHDSSSLFCLWKIPGMKQLVKLNSKQYSEYSSLWKSKMAHKWALVFPRRGGLCHWTALLQFYVSLLAAVVKVRCPFFPLVASDHRWPPRGCLLPESLSCLKRILLSLSWAGSYWLPHATVAPTTL